MLEASLCSGRAVSTRPTIRTRIWIAAEPKSNYNRHNCKKWDHGLRRIANTGKDRILLFFGVSLWGPLDCAPIRLGLGPECRFGTSPRSWIVTGILRQSEAQTGREAACRLQGLVPYSLPVCASDCAGISGEIGGFHEDWLIVYCSITNGLWLYSNWYSVLAPSVWMCCIAASLG